MRESVVVPVIRAVARRRLVETGNPSACATVVSKWCKSARALCNLYVSVIKCECVTVISPIIRSRTRHFSGVYHPTGHILASRSGYGLTHVTILWTLSHVTLWLCRCLPELRSNSFFQLQIFHPFVGYVITIYLVWWTREPPFGSSPLTDLVANGSEQYLGGIRFESWPGHRQPSLKVFVIFLSPSKLWYFWNEPTTASSHVHPKSCDVL
jgi:hypothetical protein